MFKKISILLLLSSVVILSEAQQNDKSPNNWEKFIAKEWHKVYGYWKKNKALFYDIKLQSKEIDTDIKILTRRSKIKCIKNDKIIQASKQLVSYHRNWLRDYRDIKNEQKQVMEKLYSFLTSEAKKWNVESIRVGDERSLINNFYSLLESIITNISTVMSETNGYVENRLYVEVDGKSVLPTKGFYADIKNAKKSITKFINLGKKWKKSLNVHKRMVTNLARVVEKEEYACADWNEHESEEW